MIKTPHGTSHMLPLESEASSATGQHYSPLCPFGHKPAPQPERLQPFLALRSSPGGKLHPHVCLCSYPAMNVCNHFFRWAEDYNPCFLMG